MTSNSTNTERISPSIEPAPIGPHGASSWKPLTITVATARKISGLGNTTLWQLIKDRKLDTVCVGRRRLIVFASLEALLAPDLTSEPKPRRRARPRKDDARR